MVTACTYSRVRSVRVSARTRRAGISQATIATTRISTQIVTGASATARKSSRNRPGTASTASTMRIITVSMNPPAKPEIAPYSTPKVVAISAAARPTSIDVCPPTISRPIRSNPS